ncbi:MAG: hypothetical protein GXY54_07430, partial [Deltaproteobacteria bacterium]|nr:hypothetical protein [Deltaproteobacteria bacterium]
TAEAELATLTDRRADLDADLAAARGAAAEGERDLAVARKSYLSGAADAEVIHGAQTRLDHLQARHRHLADLAAGLDGEVTTARKRADRARREADRARELAFRALRSDLIASLPGDVVEALLDVAVADEFPPLPWHDFARAAEFILDRPDLRDIRQVSSRRSALGARYGLD